MTRTCLCIDGVFNLHCPTHGAAKSATLEAELSRLLFDRARGLWAAGDFINHALTAVKESALPPTRRMELMHNFSKAIAAEIGRYLG